MGARGGALPTSLRAALAVLAGPCVLASLVACSHQMTEAECLRFRDRLRGFAEDKARLAAASASASGRAFSQPPKPSSVGDEFMKSCAGTSVTRGAYRCMEGAGDEEAFFRCLD